MTDQPCVLVVGGVAMDLVVRTPSIPGPGQTVYGRQFATIPSGRGANQAIAAARCGARVSLLARVGNDDFGQRVLLGLQAHNVDTAAVMVSEGVNTAATLIIVDEIGENAVCIASGANELLSVEDIDEHAELISQADVIVAQLEVPQPSVAYLVQEARRRGKPIIINPTPVPPEPQRIHPALFEADVLIPNEDETARLCGERATDAHSAKLAASALVARGARAVVVTLGHRGALAVTARQITHIPPFPVRIVDASGAGDAFCGAFTAAYARQLPVAQDDWEEALGRATRFAAAAGALACQKFGLQPSMPRLEDIERLLKRNC